MYKIEAPEVLIVSHQRSGTHFLQSVLAHHPKIQTRGEFVLQYQRRQLAGTAHPETEVDVEQPYRYRNKPDCINIGIVMYSQIGPFEELCAPLTSCKILHLLRSPAEVAMSLMQMEVDRRFLGSRYQAHFQENDQVVLPGLVQDADCAMLVDKVAKAQASHRSLLSGNNNVLEVTYEELTANRQVNVLDSASTEKLLNFLELDMHVLHTTLVKTSLRGTGVNQLATL